MTSQFHPPANKAEADPRRWLALAVLLLASFMNLIDVTIVNVALPSLQSELGADASQIEWVIAAYVLAVGFLLVSTIPTFSGKLLGERISGDYVLPAFVGAAAVVALLLTYPYGTLTVGTLLYLATVPLSYLRFERRPMEVNGRRPAASLVTTLPAPRLLASGGGRRLYVNR